MSESFNAYHVWLGIPPDEQPPNHYRLLGIPLFESEPEVIQHAADQRMLHIRTFQAGPRGAISQQILNELATAGRVLLQPALKQEYDATLRSMRVAEPVTSIPATPPPANPASFADSQPVIPVVGSPVDSGAPQFQGTPPNSNPKPKQFITSDEQRPPSKLKYKTQSSRPKSSSCAVPMVIGGGVLGAFTAIAVVWFLTGRNVLNEINSGESTSTTSRTVEQQPALSTAPTNIPDRNVTQRSARPGNDRLGRTGQSTKKSNANTGTQTVSVRTPQAVIDLLPMIDADRHAARGTIEISSQMLTMLNNESKNFVLLPVRPTSEYDLRCIIERINDVPGGLSFGLLMNGKSFDLSLDVNNRSGVETLDEKELWEHVFGAEGDVFPVGRQVRINITVRSNGVAVDVDGRRFYQWTGNYRQLSSVAEPSIANRNYLNIHSSQATFRFHELQYVTFKPPWTPLDASMDTPPLRSAGSSVMNETDSGSLVGQPANSLTNNNLAPNSVKPVNPFVTESTPANSSNEDNPFATARKLSEDELKTIEAVNRQVKLFLRELKRQDIDAAERVVNDSSELATFPEAKQKVDGMNQLLALHESFRAAIVTACGKLQPGDELEVNDRLLIVVRSSEERVEMRYANTTSSKTPAELPANLAVEILFQTRDGEPTAEMLLVDGAAFAVEGGSENLNQAREKWNAAGEKGADVAALLSILEE